MSPVRFFAKPPRSTLFLVIGAQNIDCGVIAGSGVRAAWIKDSLLTIHIKAVEEVESPVQGLIGALQRLHVSLRTLPPVDQVRVIVADVWLAVAGMPWSPSLKSTVTAESYARVQLAGAGFEIEPADKLKLDDAPFGGPRLAIAYPVAVLAALDQLASRLNSRLTSILPLSVAAWAWVERKLGTRPPALIVVDAGLMVFMRGTGEGRPCLSEVAVRTEASGGAPSEQSVRNAWQRLCLRDPHLARVEQLAVLDLASFSETMCSAEKPFAVVGLPPQHSHAGLAQVSPGLRLAVTTHSLPHALDALSISPPLTLGRWLTLGATALFVGVMIVQAVQTNLAVRSLTAQLNAATSAAQPAPRPISWSREELMRVRAVNVAIRELNMPISPILRALQPPRGMRVAVLSVETTGMSSSAQASGMKIVAQAHTGAEMARYVAFVAASKPFIGAYLTRHEIDETTPGQPYRFTVEALWDE